MHHRTCSLKSAMGSHSQLDPHSWLSFPPQDSALHPPRCLLPQTWATTILRRSKDQSKVKEGCFLSWHQRPVRKSHESRLWRMVPISPFLPPWISYSSVPVIDIFIFLFLPPYCFTKTGTCTPNMTLWENPIPNWEPGARLFRLGPWSPAPGWPWASLWLL